MPTLQDICDALGGELHGAPNLEILGVASVENAGPSDIAAIDSERYLRATRTSEAGAFLTTAELAEGLARNRILVPFPLVALNRVIEVLDLAPGKWPAEVHPTAVVEQGAHVGEGVHIGPYAVVHAGARIGERSVLRSHVVIEGDVVLGTDCCVEPGAVVHDGARIGNRVRIGAHAVISRQGFGFAAGPEGAVRLHHVGLVLIEDDADIGAGTMIDRARYDVTTIGKRSKLDNLIHIAHNCRVGERTFIAAQTGLAGRARIGSDCEIGGQVGVGNGCGCGDRCRMGGQTGIIRMHGDDETLWGTPALDLRQHLRQVAWLRKMAGSAKED